METKPWGDLSKAKVLVIGQDPNLRKSPTMAEFAFFADYYFRPKPSQQSERRKFDLATSTFQFIRYLTAGLIKDEEVCLTNLCNEKLPRPNFESYPNALFYIDKVRAERGIEKIKQILAHENIKIVLAMSQQVNYWLGSLGVYSPEEDFVKGSIPDADYASMNPPAYKPRQERMFTMICGRIYPIKGYSACVIPITHVKRRQKPDPAYENALMSAQKKIVDIHRANS